MTWRQIAFDAKTPLTPDADILLFCRGEVDEAGRECIRQALAAKGAGAVVLRRLPQEFPAYCDPVTMDIRCATFDGFAVRRAACEAVGGLDTRLGEAAATDLALRLTAAGYTVRYLPGAGVRQQQPSDIPYADRLVQSLMMRCKHGNLGDIWRGKVLILKALRHPGIYRVARGELIKKTLVAFVRCLGYCFKKRAAHGLAEFEGVDYALSRGDYRSHKPTNQPLVSIIVRTYKRPEVLRLTLESLRHQTYPNLEIVVVEDGGDSCRAMLKADFADLPIRYHPLMENVGRAAAANEGFRIAKGDYFNLLDDDDYLLPEHIEIALGEIDKNGADMVFLRCIALETVTESADPYRFKVCGKMLLDFPRVDVFTMVRRCVTTDHGVLFGRELIDKTGGMRTELGAHEDWSLVLRMMAAGSWAMVPYATCCYNVPADKEQERARLARYAEFDDALLHDDQLVYSLTARQLKGFYENTIHDFMYLKQHGKLDAYLDAEYEKLEK